MPYHVAYLVFVLQDLFTRIGPITSLSLRYDRAGRSTGTAFVTYPSISSANLAVREFDGANAAGQPIRLTLLPSGPLNDGQRGGRGGGGGPPASRNPFDSAIKPGRSLFDRIEDPQSRDRDRSRSPGASSSRRTNTMRPPPEGVDRYVPSSSRGRRSRTRSPRRSPIGRGRRGGNGGRGRGDRDRDRDHDRRAHGGGSEQTVNGRPRKTRDELDQEMEDYWGTRKADDVKDSGAAISTGPAVLETAPVVVNTAAAAPAITAVEDDDIDMIS